MEQDALFWIWLANALGPGNSEAGRLLLHFDNPYTLFQTESDELERVSQLSQRSIEHLTDKNLQASYEILHYCEEQGITVLHYGGPGYPERLKQIADPPVVLYCRGKMPDLDARLPIAVVGTRRMSEYGRKNAYTIAYELAYAGAVVVSGMALGIDSIAACGALEAGGTTVAVLGSGVDVAYPAEHARLLEIISKNGAVLSEYPPGTKPTGYHFPVRNRIISGLCAGTLVVEADEHSGALITAHHALEQGRNVFSIPADLGEKNAGGTNALLHDGAIMALDAGDILKEYPDAKGVGVRVSSVSYARIDSSFREEKLAKYGVRDRVCDRDGERIVTQATPPQTAPEPAAQEKPRKATGRTGDPVPSESAGKAKTDTAYAPDRSAEVLAGLSAIQKEIFEAFPLEGAVSLDQLAKDGKNVGTVIAALTVLEIRGLIHSLPGGLYTRA